MDGFARAGINEVVVPGIGQSPLSLAKVFMLERPHPGQGRQKSWVGRARQGGDRCAGGRSDPGIGRFERTDYGFVRIALAVLADLAGRLSVGAILAAPPL